MSRDYPWTDDELIAASCPHGKLADQTCTDCGRTGVADAMKAVLDHSDPSTSE